MATWAPTTCVVAFLSSIRPLVGRAVCSVALVWLALACAVAAPARAQSAPDSRDARGSILRIQRLGADDGWVLTDAALLLTRDGGATWSNRAPSRPLERVTDAFFVDAARGWLAGVAPESPGELVVLDTANGGASWREQRVGASALPSGEAYARAQVHFSDPAHGWLLGQVATSAAFSLGELLRTTDGGASWQRLPRPPAAGRFVFVDAERGFMAGSPVSESLYRTLDGGRSWQVLNLAVSIAASRALYGLPVFHSPTEGAVAVTLPGGRPRLLSFVTHDGGRSWRPAAAIALPPGDYEEPVPAALAESGRPAAFAVRGSITLSLDSAPRTFSLAREEAGRGPGRVGATPSVRALFLGDGGPGWAFLAEGACDESGCRQVTRLLAWDGPAYGTEAARDLLVRTETLAPLTLPPAEPEPLGATISFDKGFDKCAAATTGQMQTWKTSSPYKDANIYFGGAARGCSQPNLSASWVSTVFGQGWRLIPTWVGPQAPCTAFGTRFSYDPATARSQGLAEADAAVSAASALGLGTGTPLYYDLENYNETSPSCSAAVRAFVEAWVERVKSHDYVGGVYGNAYDAQADWRPGVIASPPDAVWIASWACGTSTTCNWSPTVFGIPGLSDSYWANNQRIRQYWGDHNETYGGVTFNIDSDYANGPVAVGDTPPSCVATVPADHWRGEYFNNQTLSGTPTMVRDDGTAGLGFNWVDGSPGCGIGADHFSVRWTRTLAFAAGTYRFTTRTDDGVRFFVDDVLRIDQWIDRGATSNSVHVTLGAGNHTLRMEYYENGGSASAELSWTAATEFLCDDGDACFGLFGPSSYWHRETACGGQSLGYGGDMYWTYVNGDTVSNYARWMPTLGGAGPYEVRVFVPRCHATSQQAKYKIVHNGVIDYRTVNQNAIFDGWVSLGSFAFAGSGSEYVELSDATGEPYTGPSPREVGFDAVRFVPAESQPPPAGGWAFPVGSADSGAGWRVTLGLGQSWQSASGIWYRGHLAEDWAPVSGSALGQPVYAAAAGQVVTVLQNCGNYVDVVIIKHQVAGISEPIYSFYGHLEADGYVSVGDSVARRQQIGVIGDPVTFFPHLHFEIKNHTALVNRPFSSCSNIPNGVYISAGYSGESGQYGGGDYYDPTNDGVVGNFYYHPTRFVTQRSGTAARALAAPAPLEPTFEDGLPRCEERP